MADAQIRLWILRLLVPFGIYKQFVRDRDFFDDDIARALGFGNLLDGGKDAPGFDRQMVIGRLRDAWKEAEGSADELTSGSERDRRVWRLGHMLGLASAEIEILRFRLESQKIRELRDLLDMIGSQSLESLCDLLACALALPVADIRSALRFDGGLVSSGIVELEVGNNFPFSMAINLLSCIVDEIDLDHDDPLIYFRSRIIRSERPRLTADRYPHAARDISLLSQYLQDSAAQGRKGVNVLIHGEPGSGKTEFVRMLAESLGAELFEVTATRRDGHVLNGNERFRAYRLGQSLLGQSSGRMILFDEIEDVFQEEDKGPRSNGNQSGRKSWVNKMLENNPVPAFWITNNLWVIDRAFLRRFDYVLEMNAPPRSVRGRILDDYLADLPVSEEWKRRMAEHEGLVPAIVERAAKVVRAAKDTQPQREVERTLERVMGNTLEVMGLPREPRHWSPAGKGYRLDVLNADCDMAEVQAGLIEHREGRICLYGPPGTGKTAFGHYIAETLDQPLLLRRASDIVSPFLGITERNMAKMFRQAQEEEAVLLLDEADSFLQDRQGAQRSWEITEVNEMLTQMESFEGVFIASTNLMSRLDPAALRRFDLKIRLDYLRAEQAWSLFVDIRGRLGITDDMDLESSVAHIGCLTSGDFANVVRQARLRPVRSSMALLQRLRSECEMKPDGHRRSIGFAA